MILSLILVSHLRLDCSSVSGIHRNIDSNKRVDILNNMQAAIVKKIIQQIFNIILKLIRNGIV